MVKLHRLLHDMVKLHTVHTLLHDMVKLHTVHTLLHGMVKLHRLLHSHLYMYMYDVSWTDVCVYYLQMILLLFDVFSIFVQYLIHKSSHANHCIIVTLTLIVMHISFAKIQISFQSISAIFFCKMKTDNNYVEKLC